MKKIVIIAIVFLLFFKSSFSQASSDKGYFSVTLGPAFPIGDFAGKNVKSTAGFPRITASAARIGKFLQFSYSRLLGKRFGFSASMRGQINPLNVKALQTSFSKTIVFGGVLTAPTPMPPLTPLFSYTTYPNWKFEKKSWLFSSLLVGGYGEFPAKKSGKTVFTVKPMIGAVYVTSPELRGRRGTDTASAYMIQTSSKAWGFTYSLAGGIKYNIYSRLSLLASVEYIGTSRIKFKDVIMTVTATKGTPGLQDYMVQQSVYTGTAQQKISSLNLNIGIGLSL